MKEPSVLCGDDVAEFIGHYFPTGGPTLFIGNIGFGPDVLYFPLLLRGNANTDFRFMVEQRASVPAPIDAMAAIRQGELAQALGESMKIAQVPIIADDGAPVAGRNACAQIHRWLQEKQYTDVVVDATGMSRGTCFPIAKQLREFSSQSGVRVHLLIADSAALIATVRSVSSDRADWMHGFHGEVETDDSATALKLWVVQLAERHGGTMQTLFKELGTPSEVCPIIPFPSENPRRGDDLLFELRSNWLDEWGETPLSLIHAHESDPMDVYRSIVGLHNARLEALEGAGLPSLTILSPIGRRLPGIGMLLAALDYELPMFYLETVGYELSGELPKSTAGTPAHRWHFRLDTHVDQG
ncbi:MAG: hypothetical protein Q7K57_00790 [Burkholderiaceae bacterium]|nr:hypothetical protein [Polaromonas sp.]MDO8767253.1 hypothetical protein [Burkholderiaceae bacterium]MDO9219221.1 hypothetical protein [Lacisediminimonas sp.]